MTNPFRRSALASLLMDGEAWFLMEPIGDAEVTVKAKSEEQCVVGVGMLRRRGGVSGET